MREETRNKLIKYLVCLVVASLITVGVFAIRGFFTDSVAVNIQILSDGFSVTGILFLLFAGMIFISSQGALIGITYVLRNVFLAFVPMGRNKHEFFKDYRDRKLAEKNEKPGDACVFVVGLLFLIVGIIFTVIWQNNYYNGPL